MSFTNYDWRTGILAYRRIMTLGFGVQSTPRKVLSCENVQTIVVGYLYLSLPLRSGLALEMLS